MGVLHGGKVRPSKRKLTSRQAGKQARVVRNGRTAGPALLAYMLPTMWCTCM
jgi:hypothetical protein